MNKRTHIDVGDTFGRLTVIVGEKKMLRKNTFAVFVTCRCACGKEKTMQKYSLLSGSTQSCGCLMKERVKAANITHGMEKSREYRCWRAMINRCRDNGKKQITRPNEYKYYISRGITVSDDLKTFEKFISFIGPMPSDKHSIDRIDNTLGYTPTNIKWATAKEQAANRRKPTENSSWFKKGIQNNPNVLAKSLATKT